MPGASTVKRPRGPYSDVIRERWRRPRFRGELAHATATAEDVNPLCGDRVRIAVAIRDDTVTAARFTGDACAICLAAADVVAELATGARVEEARAITAEQVQAVLEADIRPTRLRCLTLPLSVTVRALAARP